MTYLPPPWPGARMLVAFDDEPEEWLTDWAICDNADLCLDNGVLTRPDHIEVGGRMYDDMHGACIVRLDLTHPETAYGVMRRLALALGAPPEEVERCIEFAEVGGSWRLVAGGYDHGEPVWEWPPDYVVDAAGNSVEHPLAWRVARGITDRAEAIAAACRAFVEGGGQWTEGS